MARHRAVSPRMRVVIKQLVWIVDASYSTAMLRQEMLLVPLVYHASYGQGSLPQKDTIPDKEFRTQDTARTG